MKRLSDFEGEFRNWTSLTENERRFFVGDEYLPLHPNHAERISVISGQTAEDFTKIALHGVPGYSSATDKIYKFEDVIPIEDVWGDDSKVQKVRDWLYNSGVPFSTTVYLLYDSRLVVKTEWKILVTYWDALAWSVGMAMLALDSTKSWVCEFHHENFITFYKN